MAGGGIANDSPFAVGILTFFTSSSLPGLTAGAVLFGVKGNLSPVRTSPARRGGFRGELIRGPLRIGVSASPAKGIT